MLNSERIKDNDVIVFSKRPTMSWVSENTPYKITINGNTIHYHNTMTGGGTYDHINTFNSGILQSINQIEVK